MIAFAVDENFNKHTMNGVTVSRRFASIVILLLITGCDRPGEPAVRRDIMQDFSPGHVWVYDTRPGEEGSRIIVCRVEADPKIGEIVHIHVNGLRLKNKHASGGFSDEIAHMPYAGDALRKTVTKLESTAVALPAFEDGYREWRSAFEDGKAGVWTASVAEAITGMESALN